MGVALTALAAAGALSLAGCSATAGNTPAAGETPTAGDCGSVPEVGAKDPGKLLSGFTDDVQAGYNAYPYEIHESAWSKWKSDKTDGFTAAIVGQAPAAPFIATYQGALAESLKAYGVDVILNVAPNDPTDVPGQLQQFAQALSLKPDIIFFNAAAPEAAIDLVSQAHDAGIPVISMVSQIDSPYAISVTYNANLQAMVGAAETVKNINGKGSLLEVTGIPGISNEIAWEDGTKKALALCPDVTIAGQAQGMFQPPVAQQAVVQYLATNPAGVDAVLQAGTMGWAIRDAFQQSGMPVPPIADIGASQGFAAWAEGQNSYPYVGTATPAVPMAQSAAQIGLKVLSGAGPKVNHIVWQPHLITAADLSTIVDPSWSDSDGTDLSPDGVYFTDKQIAEFFNNPDLGPQSPK
jgi:ribose transport system substrate-binding protein